MTGRIQPRRLLSTRLWLFLWLLLGITPAGYSQVYYTLSDNGTGTLDQLRRYPLAGGSESTIVGSNTTNFPTNPGAMAYDAANNRLLVLNVLNNTPYIAAVNLNTNAVSTFLTPTAIPGAANTTLSGTGLVVVAQSSTTVSSIVRTTPTAAFTNAGTVTFTVTFGANVTGVTTGNFDVIGTAGVTSASSVSGSGNSYQVTVSTGSATNNGTLTLRLSTASGISPSISTTLPFSDQSYSIDKAAPDVTITGNPTNPSNSSTATFTFSGTDPTVNGVTSGIAGYQVRLDGGSFSPATSPRTYTGLADGNHTFEVRAVDVAGNVDPTPASYTWTIDTTPPPAPVVVTPANGSLTNNNTPTYSGTAEANATVTVLVDGSSVGNTTANASGNWAYTPVTPLAQGSHVVRARATDAAGNTSVDSNTNTFTVDTTPPNTTITANPTNPSNSSTATFQFTGSDGSGSIAGFQAQLDGGGYVAATSPRTYTGLADGSHTFQVRAVDAAGNVDPTPASYTWIIDTTPPPAPVVVTPANGSLTNTSTPTYTGTAEANVTVTVIVDGSSVGNTTANASGNWSLTQPTALAEGSHTVRARATDAAGNTSVDSNTNTFTVDTTPPPAPVTLTPANGSFTNDNTPTYSGTAETGSTVTVIVDGSSVGNTTANASGNWVFTQPTALSQGAHTVRARATDAAGNTSVDSNTNTFIVDTTPPPAPVVVTPANGSITNNNTPTYTGTAEANSTVTVIVDGSPIGTTTANASGNWSRTQPIALSQGPHTVRATATDVAGNTSPSSNTNNFTVDTTPPPAPVVVTPANGSSVSTATPTYTGTAEASSTVTVIVDASSIGNTTANASGNWSLTQPTALATGSHTVRATATDAAGNTSASSATNNFTVLNPATYTSSTADQPNTSAVTPGSTNQAILRVAIVIGGGNDNPLNAQSFSFTTNGSTNPADIAAARVYYTGTSGTFATTTQFGSTVTSPSGSFSITGSQQLTTGTNYFFLVYNVAANATGGNLLDATVPSLTISGTAYTPSVTSPSGSRRIIDTDRVAGSALEFAGDATPGYVNFSADVTNPAPILGSQYTQAVWIKPAIGTGSTDYYVLGNGTGNSAAPFIYVTGNGRLGAGFGTGTALISQRTGPNTIDANQWHHVVSTYNGSTLLVYLDGEPVISFNTSNTVASTRVNFIGSVGTSGTNFFPGDIDEVSQWNRALSRTEIRLMRHLTLTGTESGLVSYLQFNESGSTTTDAISRTVGTLTGATRVVSTAPVGYGTANLQTVTANTTYTFTGTNVSIAFAGVSGSSETVVFRLDGKPLGTQPSAAGLQKTFVPAYWIVDKYSGGSFTTANVTYTLSPTDISAADAATPANLKLFKRDSNSDRAFDAPISATAANAAAGTVTFPVSSFSQTVIGTFGTSPLPVELVSFTAERQGEDGLLRWTTAQEKNNAYFEVESSADGLHFRSIGRRTGAGTTSATREYQLTDPNLSRYGAAVVYYRLRQVDFDGSQHESDVVTLKVPLKALTAEVFPNPATDQLSIRIAGLGSAKVQLQLLDAQGRLVRRLSQQVTNGSDLKASVDGLPNGVYTLRLLLPDQVLHRSIVVQH